MGCCPNRTKLVKNYVYSKTNSICCNKIVLSNGYNTSKNVINRITTSSWEHIVDYLSYSELREVGKTTKYFNFMSKEHKILIKFFQRKGTPHQKQSDIKVFRKISSFTVNNNYNSMYTTSDEKEFNTTLIINNYINTN